MKKYTLDEVEQDIEQTVEGMECVHLTFPAKPHYAEALERYNENPTEENLWELQEIVESELENLYDYDNPLEIECELDRYRVVGGKVEGILK